jgi:hypothetical protein
MRSLRSFDCAGGKVGRSVGVWQKSWEEFRVTIAGDVRVQALFNQVSVASVWVWLDR